MSDEERDTSELDAPRDTVDDEPQQDATEDDGPYESQTFAELVAQEDTPDVHEEAELYAGKYDSVEDLESGYMEAQRLISERDQMSQYGQQMAPHWNEFQGWLQERSQAEAPPAAWNPPHQFDEVAPHVNLYRQDPDAWSELPDADRQKSQEYLKYYDNKWSDWFSNPNNMMSELATPLIEQVVSNQFQQFEARMQAANFLRENEQELDGHYDEFDTLLSQGASADLAKEVVRLRRQSGEATQVKDDNRQMRRDREKLKGRLASRSHRTSAGTAVPSGGHAGKSFSELIETAARQEGVNLDQVNP